VNDGQLDVCFSTGGQPTGLVFDNQGSSFIADAAHQAMLSQTINDNQIEISPVIKDFDGNPLLGPHSAVLSENGKILYFTDSGPFGESNIEKAKGSVFAVDLEVNMLKPVLHNCLAGPSGLALAGESVLYVSETFRNRVLRCVSHTGTGGVYHTSVFHQFSGRLGPTAISYYTKGELLFVARYEFEQLSKDGFIAVINSNGDIVSELVVPGSPEITGMCFSKQNPDILYVTETHSLIKILIGST